MRLMMGWVSVSSLIIFLYFLLHFPSYNCLLCNPHDKSALLQLKNSFFVNSSFQFLLEYDHCSSSHSSETESWKNITDCCGWDGITCDTKSGHVIGLHLYCSHLRGKLLGLNSSIFKLRHLQQLSLTFNDFFGSSIHSSIGNLINLTHLTLSPFRISGDLPSTISHLSKLQHFRISSMDSLLDDPTKSYSKIRIDDYTWNRLIHNATNLREIFLEKVNMSSVGESSLSLLTNLSSSLVLSISQNTQIQGKLPSNILHLPNLQEIDLSQNENLRGELPTSNWTIPLRVLSLFDTAFSGYLSYSIAYLKSLHTLDLSGCNFDGFLPPSLSNLTQLSLLDLSYNQLKGSIPQSLARCTTLEVLDLGNNNIEDLFPYSLETLPNLQVLSLRSNNFHGIITSSDTKLPFPKLRIFDISYNYFTGILPVSYVHNFQGMVNVNDNQTGLKYLDKKIFTIFTIIDLSNNMFEGEIPEAIGELISLKGLNLSHNGITGTIPQSLSHLRNLEWLDLSWNQLKGEIPMALSSLNFLAALNLSQNQFEGVIPTGGQFITFENDSYAGNPMLCGIPLSKSCNEDKEWSSISTLDDEESGFGWKTVTVGYACGMLFGIILGCHSFFIGKPQWLATLVEAVFNVRVAKQKAQTLQIAKE
ncbi:hypothetical protein VIGAN_03059600 [Vigna angularis var. angularis]|uniref:Leucine-rich repeat-containing N-terminal plant-type domain-containing protein n=1 Tax=Vigna angularis var. angularis TaxID=157739 RepID=A0A0S3RK33_PHAAN|nr:hypothetical protein VIGAN_03059600 [Vigna angularis var. angularis]